MSLSADFIDDYDLTVDECLELYQLRKQRQAELGIGRRSRSGSSRRSRDNSPEGLKRFFQRNNKPSGHSQFSRAYWEREAGVDDGDDNLTPDQGYGDDIVGMPVDDKDYVEEMSPEGSPVRGAPPSASPANHRSSGLQRLAERGSSPLETDPHSAAQLRQEHLARQRAQQKNSAPSTSQKPQLEQHGVRDDVDQARLNAIAAAAAGYKPQPQQQQQQQQRVSRMISNANSVASRASRETSAELSNAYETIRQLQAALAEERERCRVALQQQRDSRIKERQFKEEMLAKVEELEHMYREKPTYILADGTPAVPPEYRQSESMTQYSPSQAGSPARSALSHRSASAAAPAGHSSPKKAKVVIPIEEDDL